MDELLCRIGQTLAQGKLHVKMSQSSELEHVETQCEPTSSVLNFAKKEWTA
jgi:hypothetical protein